MKDFSHASFPPEVISVMEVALDAAVASLPEPVHSSHVQALAEAILRGAHSGERDPAILQRLALDELHHQKRHRAAHDSKVSYGNDVLMTNCGGCESFLAKARNQIRIITDQIRKNDFDGV